MSPKRDAIRVAMLLCAVLQIAIELRGLPVTRAPPLV
jgi:hypothetical protein